MKILFYAKSPCIRTYKEAKALRTHGIDTVLSFSGLTIDARYPGLKTVDAFSESFSIKSMSPYHLIEDQKIDVIHTAHPPDSSVRMLLGAHTPIVHDFHDLDSLAVDDPIRLRHERDAAEYASGLVFVSGKMEQYVRDKYPSATTESCVVPNAADDAIIMKQDRPWPDDEKHVVYAAAMPHWGDKHFRDISVTAHEITNQGIHLHIHALIIRPELKQASLKNPFLHIESTLTGNELLSALSKYDAGIIPHCGYNDRDRHHVAMSVPNKLYEYWQVGIPVICLNAKETKVMVNANRLGAIVSNYKNLAGVLDAPYNPEKVITMSGEITKLINLYEELLWL